jgi:uncharacterized protein (TIGR02147 family)
MDIQLFLLEEFKRRQKFNDQYSLRAFARDLEVGASLLSKILRGERGVGKKMCQHLQDKFAHPFTPSLLEKFKTPELQAKLLEEQLFFNVIAQWEYFAVLNLVKCPMLICDEENVARALNLTLERSKTVIKELLTLGLLEEKYQPNGTKIWVRTQKSVTTTHGVPSQALRLANAELLDLAKKKLESVPLADRDYNSATFVLDRRYLPMVKKFIQRFRNDLLSMLEELPQEKEFVYQLNIQLFPLSEDLKNKEQHHHGELS